MTNPTEAQPEVYPQITQVQAAKLYGPARAADVLALFTAAADAVSVPEDQRAAALKRLQDQVTPELVLALVLEAAGSTATLQAFLTPSPAEPQHYEMRLLPRGKGAEMVPTSKEGAGWVSAFEFRKVLAQLTKLQGG